MLHASTIANVSVEYGRPTNHSPLSAKKRRGMTEMQYRVAFGLFGKPKESMRNASLILNQVILPLS
jgi:hypothetical protein